MHSAQQGWQLTWQRRSLPLERERGGGAGVWRLEMLRVVSWDGETRDFPAVEAAHGEPRLALGEALADARFFLGFEDAQAPAGRGASALSAAVVAQFWEVQSVLRLSAYGKHASCRDKRVRPDVCVCVVAGGGGTPA